MQQLSTKSTKYHGKAYRMIDGYKSRELDRFKLSKEKCDRTKIVEGVPTKENQDVLTSHQGMQDKIYRLIRC